MTMFRKIILQGAVGLLLVFGFWVYSGTYVFAEPNTGGNSARSPKCQAEYEQCAKNCDKTQIDVDNQIQLCKDKCASDTDTYCSRTLTRDPTTGTLPKTSVGTLQNAPVTPAPPKTTPKAPTTGGTTTNKQ